MEAPQHEARSLAVLAEAKRLVPGKPVRYVLTTHHHFDHAGGLRTYVAEGATVVTHQSNVPLFREDRGSAGHAGARRTIGRGQTADLPGRVGQARDHRRQADDRGPTPPAATATRTSTLIYLPGPRILVEGDAGNPGPADAPPPAQPPADAVKLCDDLQRLKLNVATIAPVHGRGAVSIAEFRKFLGRR